MSKRSPVLAVRALAASAALAVGVAGCSLIPVPHHAGRPIGGSVPPASALVVILDSRSAQDRAEFRSVVVQTAQAGEHLIVVSDAGTTLGSFTSPGPPRIVGPDFPVPPSGAATSFQRATYRKSLSRARSILLRDQNRLRIREQRSLLAWADGAVATALSAAQRQATTPGALAPAITEAVADVAQLQQTGVGRGSRRVLGIIGADGFGQSPAPLQASLAGMTVAVTGVPDSTDDAAWQADLLEAGAGSAFVFTPASAGSAAGVVQAGLNGRGIVMLSVAGLNYGPAQYTLPRTATPSLLKLLRLLSVTYPDATATINGYTDNIPVPGGNLSLSWKRARQVLVWLTDRGVSSSRLQAIGHGAADPVAPNQPGGQPLNRRVVIIISPDG